MKGLKNLFAWLQKNENHLSTLMFVGGTTADILTLSKVSLSYGIELFGAYAAVIVIATLIEHYLNLHEATEGPFLRGIRVVFTFIAEFVMGAFLSGLFVFYARTASLAVSWPFILILVAILFGNEFLLRGGRRERLAFRAGLLFFTLYAYVIFVLPIFLHHLGPYTFLESSAVTVALFALFLLVLGGLGWRRLKESLTEIVVGVAVIIAFVNACYFTGIIPPLPLSLRDAGVYHSITRTTDPTGDSLYEVQAEATTNPWWDILHVVPTTVHVTPGSSLSVYSAVFAPIALTTAVVHEWQWFDPAKHAWTTRAEIAFPIDGGRDGGYRGYSTLTNLAPGKYRVYIKLLSGQTVGRLDFNVVSATSSAATITETK
ncbi:MAG: DUF2914 domain-containing protein [Candidatus Pacebacteria bacterium]|nr:DUF2914 domain-containing protein [Candidatus Paceibacterota bacterium]